MCSFYLLCLITFENSRRSRWWSVNWAIVLRRQRIQPPETWLESISKPDGLSVFNAYHSRLGWSWAVIQEEGVSLLVFGFSSIWPAVGFVCAGVAAGAAAGLQAQQNWRRQMPSKSSPAHPWKLPSLPFSPSLLCVWDSRHVLGQRQGYAVVGMQYPPSPVQRPPESGFRLGQCQTGPSLRRLRTQCCLSVLSFTGMLLHALMPSLQTSCTSATCADGASHSPQRCSICFHGLCDTAESTVRKRFIADNDAGCVLAL